MKKELAVKKVRRGISLDPVLLRRMQEKAEEKTGGNLSLLLARICMQYLDGKVKI